MQPADGQGRAPLRPDFRGHLIGGASDPPGFDFDDRFDVVERLFEELQGVFLGPLLR